MNIWIKLKEWIILLIKKYLNVHKSGQYQDVFIFAMPRGGSTWLLELISTQPGFKYINEPFSLRNKRVRKYFGFSEWDEYYQKRNEDKIVDYLKGISNGTISFMNPFPLRKFYRFFTNRTVFKIIHCCEDKLDKIINDPGLNSYAIILLRHPIAVSLSRKQLPRLKSFIFRDCSDNFNAIQLMKAKQIIDQGTHLEKGILSWCLQNYLLLNTTANNVSIITYEQLVLEPQIVLKHLNSKICMTDLEKILHRLHIPSGSSNQSDDQTVKLIANRKDPKYLVSKWRSEISTLEEERLMQILDIFGINAYVTDQLISKKFWIYTKQN